MGKTSINIVEQNISTAQSQSGGNIAVVLSDALKGRYDKVYTITSVDEFVKIFGNGTTESYRACKYLLNRGHILKVVRTADADGSVAANASIALTTGTLTVAAVASGTAYNGIAVKFIDQGGTGAENLFSVEVYESRQALDTDPVTYKYNNLLESYSLVSLDPNSMYYFGTVLNESDIIKLSVAGTAADSAISYTDGEAVGVLANGTGTATNTAAACTLAANYLVDLEIDFIAVIVPGYTDATAYGILATLLKTREDVVGIIDNDTENVISSLDPNVASYVLTYYPKVRVNALGGLTKASYCVADKLADMFDKKQYSEAPAGIDNGYLDDVVDLEKGLTAAEIASLQEKHINPIVTKSGIGCVIWGQDTAATRATTITTAAVRLLVNYFKREVYKISQKYIFRKHIQFTWDQWVNEVEPIVRNVFNVNGLRAYSIACDSTTMTESDIQNGIMRGVITIWPVGYINKIEITFAIDNNGVSFQ